MAQANSTRPLSPHLAIWRWGPAMVVSILHRAAGNGLAFGGIALLLWWLGALASGPAAYQTFLHWIWTAEPGNSLQMVTTLLGKLVLVGLSWAFFQHMSSGIRHESSGSWCPAITLMVSLGMFVTCASVRIGTPRPP